MLIGLLARAYSRSAAVFLDELDTCGLDAFRGAMSVSAWATMMPGLASRRLMVGRETEEALARSRWSQRRRARAARISSLVRRGLGLGRRCLNPSSLPPLRDRLQAEIANLCSAEEAAGRARRVLGAKNGLTTADATLIEEAFVARMTKFDDQEGRVGKAPASAPAEINGIAASVAGIPPAFDKSALAIGEPRRHRAARRILPMSRHFPAWCAGTDPRRSALSSTGLTKQTQFSSTTIYSDRSSVPAELCIDRVEGVRAAQ